MNKFMVNRLPEFPRRPHVRRGVVAVARALVLSVLLLVVFVIFDLGLAVFHDSELNAAAEALARESIIRGALAAPEKTSWGPAAISTSAASQSEPAALVAQSLILTNPADVSVRLTWPDGDIQENCRVVVQLNYTHKPLVPAFNIYGPLNLQTTCTMRIVH